MKPPYSFEPCPFCSFWCRARTSRWRQYLRCQHCVDDIKCPRCRWTWHKLCGGGLWVFIATTGLNGHTKWRRIRPQGDVSCSYVCLLVRLCERMFILYADQHAHTCLQGKEQCFLLLTSFPKQEPGIRTLFLIGLPLYTLSLANLRYFTVYCNLLRTGAVRLRLSLSPVWHIPRSHILFLFSCVPLSWVPLFTILFASSHPGCIPSWLDHISFACFLVSHRRLFVCLIMCPQCNCV